MCLPTAGTLELDDLWRAFPIQTILWFNEVHCFEYNWVTIVACNCYWLFCNIQYNADLNILIQPQIIPVSSFMVASFSALFYHSCKNIRKSTLEIVGLDSMCYLMDFIFVNSSCLDKKNTLDLGTAYLHFN